MPFAARVKDQAMFHLKHRARSKSQPNPCTDPPSLEVKSNRLAVLAVRSLPAAERLDANVAAVVEALCSLFHSSTTGRVYRAIDSYRLAWQEGNPL